MVPVPPVVRTAHCSPCFLDETATSKKQFWSVLEGCLDHLSPRAARVFTMRECLGLDTEEICAQLGISTGNCHVMLHRARLQLRGCMDCGWGRKNGEQ